MGRRREYKQKRLHYFAGVFLVFWIGRLGGSGNPNRKTFLVIPDTRLGHALVSVSGVPGARRVPMSQAPGAWDAGAGGMGHSIG